MHAANAWKNKQRPLLFLAFVTMIPPAPAYAAPEECADWVAKAISTEGTVERHSGMDTAWQPVRPNQVFCPGSAIRTGPRSRAALLLRNQSVLRVDQRSAITFPAAESETPFWLRMLNGAVNVITRTPKKFQIDTPFVNAAVDGTEFLVTVAENEAAISVFEGQVSATNPQGQRVLRSGESASAGPGQAPVPRILAHPRDAVQWTLYYPPLLTFHREDFGEGDENAWQGRVHRSIAAYRENRLSDALKLIAQTPQDNPGASFFIWRAALLLETGRSDEASADLQTALGLDPNHGPAHAQQAIIAITQNRRDEALEQARRATTLTPQSAASWIALSYAEQAIFNLQAALDASRQAVEKEPGNALAWARLAELRLSLADLDGALAAAEKAATLDPNLARTHSVLGFAWLAQINTRAARLAFEHAIVLAPSDPLPRLGLGLAKIRDGELAPGREDIEIATALDPNNALVRSYMGKAYYEEKREKLAASQFDIAKTLDPNDPTPWFYDAILKQSVNRPVEALRDLQKSIESNDNRAVYRSRLLLDSDAAARSASQARIYSDLGFQQLALVEGWKSLNTDPANHSAHRFLADSYAALPRHEIARVSELLQAQLLQPLNINPVQPQLAESHLGILDGAGPSRSSFNEFNPLFTRNRMTLQTNGIMGGNGSIGNDLVLSGMQGKISYSIGQFHYETNGFRPNNDLRHDIYNLFTQVSLSPKASVQFEYASRETGNGDLRRRFDREIFSPTDRRSFDSETTRLGWRYSSTPQSDWIASITHRNAEERQNLLPGPAVIASTKAKGYTGEIQYLFRNASSNLIVGAGHHDLDRLDINNYDFTPILGAACPNPPFASCTDVLNGDTRHINGYAYSTFSLFHNSLWTIGASYDSFTQQPIAWSQLNPKFGLQWNITPRTMLRLASFKAMKRSLVSNQTIEPTQVAGFNQLFDDINGTKSRRHGVALEHQFSENLFGGIEVSRRLLKVPVTEYPESFIVSDQNERMLRGYVYWTPATHLTTGLEHQSEKFRRDAPFGFQNPENPGGIEIQRTSLLAGYFHPGGLFLRGKVMYVGQQVELPTLTAISAYQDNFWLADAAVGYRLPKRRGLLSLEARNLLNKAFNYQDTNFQTSQPGEPLFQAKRVIYARFSLIF